MIFYYTDKAAPHECVIKMGRGFLYKSTCIILRHYLSIDAKYII